MAKRERKGGRTTPKGTRPTQVSSLPTISSILLAGARKMLAADVDLDEAEVWASAVQTIFDPIGDPPTPSENPSHLLNDMRRDQSPAAALLTRAIALYGPAHARAKATQIYDALIRSGVEPPSVASQLGQVEPIRAVKVVNDWDDGFAVHLDCRRGDEVVGIGVSISQVLECMADDFVYGPTIEQLEALLAEDPHTSMIELPLADARALVEYATAGYELPLDDDHDGAGPAELRALVQQRFSLLPAGGADPKLFERLSDAAAREIADAFVASKYTRGIEDAASYAKTFCLFASQCDGNPYRWSPERVGYFLGLWVPIQTDETLLWHAALIPALVSWLRFSAAHRGLSDDALEACIDHITIGLEIQAETRRDEAEAARSSRLGPVLDEMRAEGVDVTDPDQVDRWLDSYNSRAEGDRLRK